MLKAKGPVPAPVRTVVNILIAATLGLALLSAVAARPGFARDPLWDQLPWDERMGLSWYEVQGAKGDAEAQFRAARLYELGIDTQIDYEAARQWYKRAAEQGHAQASFRLALMLQEGRGGARDLARAAELYQVAAAADIAPAKYNLAVLKQLGIGVPQDPGGAAALYREATKDGYAPAAVGMAQLLAVGWEGRPAEPVAALAWAIRAETMGAPDASALRRQLEAGLSEGERAEARQMAKNAVRKD